MAKFRDGYVIEPESFWRPAYRISPFNTSFISRNHLLIRNGEIHRELISNYFGELYTPCQSGKQAIYLALSQYGLKPDDEVWIITTSGNRYISRCVTKEIETICKW